MTEQIELYNELSQNFIEYAAAVNSDRSIPDATTGLKPVARRILWDMFNTGVISSKPHVKSARVVGSVLATLHPHGDASVYGALVRLSQDWIMRYPLIDLHGNNGNLAGDGPASMRYTESRLSKIAEEGLFTGIKKKNVDFTLTYDDSAEEPITLPAIFPNLLCNPNSGIGVAIASSWAPHNLTEVALAIFDYLDGKEPMLPGPDFPTGGVIINKDDIPAIMKTGHGSVKIRGQYKIEKQTIIFYEIPYGTTIESLLNEIGMASDNQEIQGIEEVRDESNKKGVRIVIECSRDANPESIVTQLFAKTNLQTTFSYNQIGLVNKTPTELNLKDCIEIYIVHNLECIRREAEFDLAKAKARKSIIEGLLKALEDIDNIIALIKKSTNATAAKDNLIKQYSFTEEQAKAIVDMKLGRLANLEKIELEKENQELESKIDKLNSLVCDEDERIDLLTDRLINLVEKYGDKRRTQLIQLEATKNNTIVAVEKVVFTLDVDGLAKTTHKKTKAKNKECVLTQIETDTSDTLLLFSSAGKMYRLNLSDFPNFSNPVNINTLIKIESSEHILAATSINTATQPYVVFFTKQGMLKKTLIEEYLTLKKNNGIIALKMKENDSIINIAFMSEENVLIGTKNGYAIYFTINNINSIGRVTVGIKAINLYKNDEVSFALPLQNQNDIALVTTHGYGKQYPFNELILQNHGGRGVQVFNVSGSTGWLTAAAQVKNDDVLLMIDNYKYSTSTLAENFLLSKNGIGHKVSKGDIDNICLMMN